MVTYDGVIRGNVVVLPDGVRLPDGTPVEVRPRGADPRDDDSAPVDAELRAAGLLDETPRDGHATVAAIDDFEPVPFTGRPLSEQIIEERR